MNDLNNSVALVFPGQGSQFVGMLAELAESHEEVKSTFDSASQIVGEDLWKMSQEGPIETLNLTQNTQPLMLAAGVAVWRAWCRNTSIRPAWMAGHSLGEYTALVCSGSVQFEDAVALVKHRACLMQQSVTPGAGAMAAIIGLDDPKIVELCGAVSEAEIVAPVNFNAPGQVVIAGHTGAVERVMQAAKDHGARRAVMLPVSVPSHCALMEPAAERLEQWIQETVFETPGVTVIHNVDVASHASPDVIRSVLKMQLYKPVRWADTIKFMDQQGVNCFLECGPGKVLTGLNKRIVKSATASPVFDTRTLSEAIGLCE